MSRGEIEVDAAHMSARASSSRSGFTLIEVIVVILVIAGLAALVAPDVFRHLASSRQATARAQIEMLNAALDAYRLDTGVYPTQEQGLESLRREPLSEPFSGNWRGPYLRKEVPADPWGHSYMYLVPGARSGWGYDLFSYGRDGELGGEGEDADVNGWE